MKVKRNAALLSLTATSCMLLPWTQVQARNEPPQQNMAAARAAESQQRAAQNEERQAQMQAARAEQAQASQQHEEMMRQAQQARQQQEQALRQQEQQARSQQVEQQRQQQEQARQQQEQARQQEQQQERQQRDQARQQQDQQRQQQQQQERQQQEQARQQQEQSRQQQEQARQQREQVRQQGQERPGMREPQMGHEQPNLQMRDHQGQPGGEHGQPAFAQDRQGNPVNVRSAQPPHIDAARVPLEKAVPMPVLASNANQADREHMQEVQDNLRHHMFAVAAADAPSNFHSMPQLARDAYFNNYQAMINNQQFIINRQNTFINALQQSQWPVWYQPEPNWQFCNGFTIGQAINCDLNWLRWGWHPYYGPEPDGFICPNNYVPTPWIYIPAYGTWRQPGVNAYAAYGPPYDYTGPISVEVFEPRRVNFDIPFGNFLPQRVVNAVYFYNAYYYPEYGRYGYMNRHGSWIWLDFGTAPF